MHRSAVVLRDGSIRSAAGSGDVVRRVAAKFVNSGSAAFADDEGGAASQTARMRVYQIH